MLTGGHATVTAAGVAVPSWCHSSLLHRTAAANGQDAGRPLFSSRTCWLLRVVMSKGLSCREARGNLAQGSQPTNFNWADPSSWSQSGAKGSAASHLAHKASLAGRVLMLVVLVSCVPIPLCTAASLREACRSMTRRGMGRLRSRTLHVVHVACGVCTSCAPRSGSVPMALCWWGHERVAGKVMEGERWRCYDGATSPVRQSAYLSLPFPNG